jgi:hypothetical protein
MTDRAVQPEAPTTEAGRWLDEIAPQLWRQPSDPKMPMDPMQLEIRKTILAIEKQARAASQERPHPCADCAEDAFTGSGRGICAYHEAAAQERPQPPLHGHQVSGDWYECTDEHPGVAQERPSIDAQTADLIDALAAHGVFSRLDFEMFVERLRHARLAGGSVASPEPRE